MVWVQTCTMASFQPTNFPSSQILSAFIALRGPLLVVLSQNPVENSVNEILRILATKLFPQLNRLIYCHFRGHVRRKEHLVGAYSKDILVHVSEPAELPVL